MDAVTLQKSQSSLGIAVLHAFHHHFSHEHLTCIPTHPPSPLIQMTWIACLPLQSLLLSPTNSLNLQTTLGWMTWIVTDVMRPAVARVPMYVWSTKFARSGRRMSMSTCLQEAFFVVTLNGITWLRVVCPACHAPRRLHPPQTFALEYFKFANPQRLMAAISVIDCCLLRSADTLGIWVERVWICAVGVISCCKVRIYVYWEEVNAGKIPKRSEGLELHQCLSHRLYITTFLESYTPICWHTYQRSILLPPIAVPRSRSKICL